MTRCTHDEKHIEKTRNDLQESVKRESEIRDRLRDTKEENEKHLEKVLFSFCSSLSNP